MSMVVPAIWWFVMGGIGAGVLLGLVRLRINRLTSRKSSSCSQTP
jgi:hypothetical protein